MRPITVTVGPLTSGSANSIALTQTPNAGALTLNGASVAAGVAVIGAPQQVLITTTGNESANSLTITGTDWAGSVISEVVVGPNATTAASVLSYATVTRVSIANNAAAALTVGTNGTGYSPWIRLDSWASEVTSLQCNVSGTVNYTVQTTNDDPNSPTNPVAVSAVTWLQIPDTNLAAQTASAGAFLNFCPAWVRVLLNSGSGSVTMTAIQSGSVTY